MKGSRRLFFDRGLRVAAAAGLTASTRAQETPQPAKVKSAPEIAFTMVPVGVVERGEAYARVRIFEPYVEALLGLEQWSHVNIFYWFDKNDTPQKRRVLRVHPRGNPDNPLTGVFACRAPVRPNLIALSVCKMKAVESDLVILESIDAWDGTPVLDLKPFIPPDAPSRDVRVPGWARGGPR